MSELSRSVELHEANSLSPNSLSDWDRIRRESTADIPVPYELQDEPCNPNDPAAVAATWKRVERHFSNAHEVLVDQIR